MTDKPDVAALATEAKAWARSTVANNLGSAYPPALVRRLASKLTRLAADLKSTEEDLVAMTGWAEKYRTELDEAKAEIARLDAELNVEQMDNLNIREQLSEQKAEIAQLRAEGDDYARIIADVVAAPPTPSDGLLRECREFVSAIVGENRPAPEWAYELRHKIDAAHAVVAAAKGDAT